MIQVLKWYQVTGSLSVSSVSFSRKILYLEGRVALGSQSFVSVLLKKKKLSASLTVGVGTERRSLLRGF